MTALPWSKFYWDDWESDEALKMCSPGAQALWMRMLCVCAKAEGYLAIAGRKLDPDDMVRLTGWSQADVRKWWDELKRWGVFSVEGRGRIYCRRMIKDARKARIARENGKNGGNPNLSNRSANGSSDNQTPTDDLTQSPGSNQKPEARRKKEVSDANASSVAGRPRDDVRTAFDEWNALAVRLGLPKALALDKGRSTAIRSRLAEGGLAVWREALAAVERSPHCRGENDRNWRADLDFVCQPKSWRRLREGFYAGEAAAATQAELPEFPNAAIRSYVVEKMTEPWAVSYLDTCSYAEADGAKTITAPNSFTATKLVDSVPALSQRGIVVVVAPSPIRSTATLPSDQTSNRSAA